MADPAPPAASIPAAPPMPVSEFRNIVSQIEEAVATVMVGQGAIVRDVLISLIGGGHVLLEGVPGLGKTMLVRTLADALDLHFSRIQFTPDLMPADITGTNLLLEDSAGRKQFAFQPGPIFANLVLADEINRASPRLQSALLECMNEGQVTVDGTTRQLPEVFQVVATRNNRHRAGTFPLPAPQLDRFLISIEMSLPDSATRAGILKQHAGRLAAHPRETLPTAGEAPVSSGPSLSLEEVATWQTSVRSLPCSDSIFAYVIRLCDALRHHPEIEATISNRGALAIMQMARSVAFLEGHEGVFPEDVKRAFMPAVIHRLESGETDFDQEGATRRRPALRLLLEELLHTVAVG